MKVAILLLATGRGTRLGSETPKAYLPIAGVPMLVRCLRRLRRLDADAQIVLAVHRDDRTTHLPALASELADDLAGVLVVDGGETRQESMARALAASDPSREMIVVHDAARPFFPEHAATRALERAGEVGGALLAIEVPDTLKRVDAERTVTETVSREGMWLAQTPQFARRDLLERALAAGLTGTDEASLLEQLGQPVEVVPGSRSNIKITFDSDLEFAELLARTEAENTRRSEQENDA